MLKELRNFNGKLICVPHKKRRKRNQHFKLYFSEQMYPLARKLNTYMKKTKFISHKQHLCGLIFLYSLQKRSDSQTFKCSTSNKAFLQFLCFRCNLIRWMSLFYVISLSLLWVLFQPPCCYVLFWKKCFERGPYFTLSPHNNSSMRPMKSLSSVCPSVCPSVTKFSQDWIISFFLILYMMIADHDI